MKVEKRIRFLYLTSIVRFKKPFKINIKNEKTARTKLNEGIPDNPLIILKSRSRSFKNREMYILITRKILFSRIA
jgi:hypothetical protein